ncbi:MAG: hypothetical protein R3E08_04400 [Thiotrichaceae bacterium]
MPRTRYFWLQATLGQQLLYGWHKNHYAKPIDKQYFFYKRLRQVFYGLAAGSVLAAFIYSGWDFIKVLIASTDNEITQDQRT